MMSEWIEYKGDGRPVDGNTMVFVRLHGGAESRVPETADSWAWECFGQRSAITHYRLAEPAAKPEPGKTLRDEMAMAFGSAIYAEAVREMNAIGYPHEGWREEVAADIWRFADTMLAARVKSP